MPILPITRVTTLTWTNIGREYKSRLGTSPLANNAGSLVRYIDTYRDPRAEVEGEEDLMEAKKRPWWAFGGKGKANHKNLSDFETPADWLNTHVNEGLDSMEVERRRKFSGWNELVTEKENMFLKFLGFFQGPILYGTHF
jgi:H+-transporting ATPase